MKINASAITLIALFLPGSYGQRRLTPTTKALKSVKSAKSTTVCLVEGEVFDIEGSDALYSGSSQSDPDCLAAASNNPFSNPEPYGECLAEKKLLIEPFWFNRDATSDTGFQFSDTKSSTGNGSYKGAVGSTAAGKATIEYWSDANDLWNRPITDLEYIQFDFFPESGSCSQCPTSCGSSFYLNILTRQTGVSTSFKDCSFDYVPESCPEGEWTTFRVDLFGSGTETTPSRSFGGVGLGCPTGTSVNTGDSPSDASDYVLGSYIAAGTGYIFAINVGDTSNNDDGLVGYIDNVQVKISGESAVRVYDFEV